MTLRRYGVEGRERAGAAGSGQGGRVPGQPREGRRAYGN
ncbi:hypothetical protein SFR_5955 [Streptomyces sp. FR-008]|nr:hypothetical protein SFR_5955 [Streptomyces sp. FR-008]